VRFESWSGQEISLFSLLSTLALGLTQPPLQWIAGVLSLGVKREVPEFGHSPPSSAEIKNEWSYSSTFPVCFPGVYKDSLGDVSLTSMRKMVSGLRGNASLTSDS
jgi:hypothetical protein